MLVQKSAVQAFDNTVGLRSVDPSLFVLDVFELQKKLVGMAIRAAAEFAAIVGEHGVDLGPVRLKSRQYIIVDQLDGGDRQLVGVEPGPGMPAVAVDGGMQIDLADTLQDTDEEGVDGNKRAGMRRLDMTLAVLRAEPLQELDLFIRQAEFAIGRGLSSRNRRSCLVNRPWRCQTPRTPPEETWMPRNISSWATRIGPWQGWARA